MKKTILFSLAAAALMLAGCAKEAPVNIEVPGTVVKVTASLGDASLTKVTTGSEVGKFAWESGDVIGVWTGSAFTPFTIEESSVGKTAGTFAGTLPEGMEGRSALGIYELFNAPPEKQRKAIPPGPFSLFRMGRTQARSNHQK